MLQILVKKIKNMEILGMCKRFYFMIICEVIITVSADGLLILIRKV